ncbi:MAG TPA: tetratricopeptide repeat protein [Rhizomicrobium sp.]|nr:tetratricopeptide repeat protein [Rhizomicrobium sp.]
MRTLQKGTVLSQLFERALGLHRAGRFAEAGRLYADILRVLPADFNTRHMLGVTRYQQGRHAEALELIGGALKLEPRSPQALANYGLVLGALRRFDEAVASFDRSLALVPENADTLNKRGNALRELGRAADALASYNAALKLMPHHADALNNRGVVLRDMGRLPEALASIAASLAVKPGFPPALNNRGNVLRDLKRSEEALASYERAIQLDPHYAEALSNRGAALRDLQRLAEALASFDEALALEPHHAEVLLHRGVVLREMRRLEESLASLDAVIAAQPDHAEAFYQRGHTLQLLHRPTEAAASFERAIALNPGHAHATGGLAGAALQACDWTRMAKAWERLQSGRAIVPPLTMLGYSDDEGLHHACAMRYLRDRLGKPPQRPRGGAAWRHDRIRLAYLSTDFKEHATAFLAVELFKCHDRSRFEVHGLSIGPDDGSPMRSRLEQSFDQFHDLQSVSDRGVAELVHRLEVDILVDLNGHTFGYRPEILAFHAAPVQVNYLGYPGTMGADFMDYIIADPVVLPRDRQPFYAEKIVHLPDCYQVNDASRCSGGAVPSRADCGLPAKGFVFCCFNNHWKITPPLFDVWMRLLEAMPDSCLWLLADNDAARANLCREAEARGIAPQRLVFAGRVAPGDHLARHRHADLFLDTLPYNAHTTASDALWMGLPLITCMGEAFAGRVAASLLRAAGLGELVTRGLEEYHTLALRLAREPALLRACRERLGDRAALSLFDTGRFRRNIEAAYVKMQAIALAGEAPYGFAVEAQAV